MAEIRSIKSASQLSPRQVAQALGVSEASVKRWCDAGRLRCSRTVGGHRRIAVTEVVRFARAQGRELANPESLGLPSVTGTTIATRNKSTGPIVEALARGDLESTKRAVFALYLAGHPLHAIFDEVLAPAMHAIGDRWQHDGLEIYRERRATEIIDSILDELRLVLPPSDDDAPLAMGATLENDHYSLASHMVDLSLREAGWEADRLGTHVPADSLVDAIEQRRPSLFWLSVSHVAHRDRLIEATAAIHGAAARRQSALVIGGRALTAELRRRLSFTVYCDDLRHLVSFAQTLRR